MENKDNNYSFAVRHLPDIVWGSVFLMSLFAFFFPADNSYEYKRFVWSGLTIPILFFMYEIVTWIKSKRQCEGGTKNE